MGNSNGIAFSGIFFKSPGPGDNVTWTFREAFVFLKMLAKIAQCGCGCVAFFSIHLKNLKGFEVSNFSPHMYTRGPWTARLP